MVTSTAKKILVAPAAAAATTAILKSHEERITKKSRTPRRFRAFERTRRSVDYIYQCLGAKNFRRAYRMTYSSFRTLEQKLHDKIVEGIKLTFSTRKAKNLPFCKSATTTNAER
jgi:hypothetical protein